MAEEMIAVDFVVPETQRRELLRDIEQDGGVVESSSELYVPGAGDPPLDSNSRFEPLIIISGVVSATYLLRQCARTWHDFRDTGGTIIDFRNGKVRVYELDSADRGTIVVMTDDARPSIHRPDDDTTVMQQIARHVAKNTLPPGGSPP